MYTFLSRGESRMRYNQVRAVHLVSFTCCLRGQWEEVGGAGQTGRWRDSAGAQGSGGVLEGTAPRQCPHEGVVVLRGKAKVFWLLCWFQH